MATKKFRCKVCGYVHEGNSAPEKCPMCQAPQSEFEEIVEEGAAAPKKGLNTNSNVYTIVYAAVMVIIVARNQRYLPGNHSRRNGKADRQDHQGQ